MKLVLLKNILLFQAVAVSLSCLAFLLMPSVNGSYWLLTDLSTQVYMIMYFLVFTAAIAIKFKHPTRKSSFKIPGGKFGMTLVGLLGLFGCIITLIVGFFPPSNISVGGFWHYEKSFISGMLIMITPVFLFFLYQRKR